MRDSNLPFDRKFNPGRPNHCKQAPVSIDVFFPYESHYSYSNYMFPEQDYNN